MSKLSIVLLLVILPVLNFAQNVNGRITSSLYSFERQNSLSESETYLRAFQTLNLNLNEGQFSLRTRVNVEANITNKLVNDPRVRFYNLFFEARNIADVATLKLGRQPLITSIAGGVYDGASLKLKHNGYALTGFFGGNVPAYQKLEITDDWENDYVLGGKLVVTSLENFKFKAMYIDKNFKQTSYMATRLDASLNPIDTLIERNSLQYRYLSGEAGYSNSEYFDATVKYDYDVNLKATSKVQFFGRLNYLDDIGFTVFYNYREPRVRYNSIFSVFDYGNTQEIEFGTDYKITSMFTVVGKFANVSFKGDDSQRLTVGVNSNYGTVSYRKTFGYAGELDAVSIHTAKSFLKGLITPSIGLAYTNYKLSEDAEKNSIVTLLAGVNYRPIRLLSLDVQGQYLQNKIYKNDLRLFVKLNFWFNTNLDMI